MGAQVSIELVDFLHPFIDRLRSAYFVDPVHPFTMFVSVTQCIAVGMAVLCFQGCGDDDGTSTSTNNSTSTTAQCIDIPTADWKDDGCTWKKCKYDATGATDLTAAATITDKEKCEAKALETKNSKGYTFKATGKECKALMKCADDLVCKAITGLDAGVEGCTFETTCEYTADGTTDDLTAKDTITDKAKCEKKARETTGMKGYTFKAADKTCTALKACKAT